MANKSTQKAGPNDSGFNISSIIGILRIISSAFKIPKIPSSPLPPPLVFIGGNIRPGLSARDIAARIISRQSQAGARQGDIFVSSNNKSEAMERIRVEETINALLTEAVVDVVIPPGVPISAVGSAIAIPVVVQGATTSFGTGNGIIR